MGVEVGYVQSSLWESGRMKSTTLSSFKSVFIHFSVRLSTQLGESLDQSETIFDYNPHLLYIPEERIIDDIIIFL